MSPHLVRQTAEALATVGPAVEQVRNGPMDSDSWEADRRTVQAPQRLALTRLTQLLDVLKEDEKDDQAGGKQQPGQPRPGGGAGGGDGLPALAQLKLLRALQAEVNERTAAFAGAHPDLSKLTPAEQVELDAMPHGPGRPRGAAGRVDSGGGEAMTTRMSIGLALVALLSCVSAATADDPPDRLEKKPQPAEQKPAPPPMKPEEKPTDDKDPPKDDSAEEAAKLREKIKEQMQAAEKKLKERDTGKDTRQLQDDALRDIDKLIDLARQPPPPPPPQQQPMDGSPPPMGGDQQPQGGKPQPQPGTQQRPQSGQARRERREQRRQQMEQQARGGGSRQQSQPGGKRAGPQAQSTPAQIGMNGPAARQPDQLGDVVKDIWGHLPETLRQEVDHYYRDRFMPRYQDLLREYYQRLAERDRGRMEDRK